LTSNRACINVVINNALLKLIHQVLAYGDLLFARDEAAENCYVIQKRKAYFDFVAHDLPWFAQGWTRTIYAKYL
jgi:hypothetical protein